MLTFVLAAICIALIVVGDYVVKALSSISSALSEIRSVLSEIRDTQRLESFRVRKRIVQGLGEIAGLLDPYQRRQTMAHHMRLEEELRQHWALLEESNKEASPERRKEIYEQWERNRQAQVRREEAEEAKKRLNVSEEQEYLKEYPFPQQ